MRVSVIRRLRGNIRESSISDGAVIVRSVLTNRHKVRIVQAPLRLVSWESLAVIEAAWTQAAVEARSLMLNNWMPGTESVETDI